MNTQNSLPRQPANFYSGENWSAEESLGYLLRQTMSALNRAIETDMRPHGLTAVQWAPLLIISRGGNPTAASLARDLSTDTGAMTRMLDRLEVKGLLTRSRSEQDRRVVVLTLTDQGRELTTRIPHHLARVYNQQLSGFSNEEFVQLKDFLRRIIANRVGTEE
ncbi:MAG: MarR family transcriptional regulator [Nevskiaceae bacterium]|jgi:DNA-binding MarR family transcriptional regulator|nr:MarR family transcriptional regulator [Nevskiaceae bacterium]